MLILLTILLAAPGYLGPGACRPCHIAQFAAQSASQHARALRPLAQTDLPERWAGQPLEERSGVVFSYARQPGGMAGGMPGGMLVTIMKGEQRVDALLEWAFGSGAQAVTPVGRYEGAFFEHRLSQYRALDHPARTIGHSGTASPNAVLALGMRQDAATITRCFGCHATGVQPGPDLSAMIPGVTCERCHGPGSQHVRAPQEAKMLRPGPVSSCAECHRMPEGTGQTKEARDPVSVRFQLVGLSASACYQSSSGRLTCVSCHNPHQDAARTAGPYVAVCLGCHTAAANSASRPAARCRRNSKQDCLACHMQKSTPLPYLTFTDHRIRVY